MCNLGKQNARNIINIVGLGLGASTNDPQENHFIDKVVSPQVHLSSGISRKHVYQQSDSLAGIRKKSHLKEKLSRNWMKSQIGRTQENWAEVGKAEAAAFNGSLRTHKPYQLI